MERKVYIDFALLKTKMNPKMITELIGVTPDCELLRGETRPELDIPRQNIWSLESKIDSEDISLHWDEIESQIGHAKEKIKVILEDGFGCVTIVVLSEGYIPKITIPAKMSQFLGYIGAMIDIDHIQCPGESMKLKINDITKEIISTIKSDEIMDHWNEIEDEVNGIEKIEILVVDNGCLPSIQILPKMLNIAGSMSTDIVISPVPQSQTITPSKND